MRCPSGPYQSGQPSIQFFNTDVRRQLTLGKTVVNPDVRRGEGFARMTKKNQSASRQVEGVPPLVFIESSLLARLLAVEWAEETTTVLIDTPN
jgi:hypothetical protein